MAKSKPRSRPAYTPPPTARGKQPTPQWYKVTMLTLLVVGLAWVVTTYLFQAQYPIPGIEQWNLGIGFALMLVGFAMMTRWR